MSSLRLYPRIAGDSHILFQPITAISSLLDLFGPLPQGRRLFGPTVLESRSRSLPILLSSLIETMKRKANKLSLEISSFRFWSSRRWLEKEHEKKKSHYKRIKFYFLINLYFFFFFSLYFLPERVRSFTLFKLFIMLSMHFFVLHWPPYIVLFFTYFYKMSSFFFFNALL